MDIIRDRSFFCSWSGGKDSCLALYHAIQNGGRPERLFTMMTEDGDRSRSHGLSTVLLELQARLLGIPIVFRSAAWDDYDGVFKAALHEFKTESIDTGVFGDIDVDSNRQWVVDMCSGTGVEPYHPLWKRPRRALLDEFIELGFKATVIVIRNDKLSADFLGRQIDQQVIADMENAGIDACGELGEYHTVVTGGPIFSANINLKHAGHISNNEYSFLKIST